MSNLDITINSDQYHNALTRFTQVCKSIAGDDCQRVETRDGWVLMSLQTGELYPLKDIITSHYFDSYETMILNYTMFV